MTRAKVGLVRKRAGIDAYPIRPLLSPAIPQRQYHRYYRRCNSPFDGSHDSNPPSCALLEQDKMANVLLLRSPPTEGVDKYESAFLGAGKGEPTIVTPKQYRQRFLSAMERYFPLVSHLTIFLSNVPQC